MKTLLNPGKILNCRYRILNELGHGGFGRAFLAEDTNRFNEPCVLKEFAPQIKGSFALKKAEELFEREAGVLYRLKHPQIPEFRELFRYKHQGQGHLLLVQDYVEGETYHNLLNKLFQKNMRFTEGEVEQLLFQLLPVLKYIHSMGVIHRDISPDNLMLRSSDRLAVLIDFGSIKEVATKVQSQWLESTTNVHTVSMMGTILGKNGYAPPEQIEKGIIQAHSDLYALAATVIVLLTSKEPKELIDPNTYQWHWQEEITLSSKLKWVLDKMLAPNPNDRYGSAIEVQQDLEKNTYNLVPKLQQIPQPLLTSKISIPPRWTPKIILFALSFGILLMGSLGLLKYRDSEFASLYSVEKEKVNRQTAQLEQRFSWGEKALIPQTTTPAKDLAIDAFSNGNYNQAASLFSASLKNYTNDPEALIYLNNARIGQEKSYRIAASVPIGSNVNAAQEILRGIAQAQYQINRKGGIEGVPLKVQIVNDDDDPKVARQIATSLGRDRNILGVLGHYASDVTLATAEIYQAENLASISPTSTSVKLSGLSPYLFRATPSDYITARALAEYMLHQLQKKKVAVFFSSQSNYSQSLKSEFMAAVSLGGGKTVNEFDLSDANFNAADSLEQAENLGAEVIMLAANNDTLNQALQVVQVNRQKLSILGGDDVYTPKTLQVLGESALDLVLAIPWHIKSSPNAEFTQVANKLWQSQVNWRSAMAYDSARALIAAIGHQSSRQGVQKALSDPNFSTFGASEQVDFLPSGDRLKQIELVEVNSSTNSSFGYEFVPIAEP